MTGAMSPPASGGSRLKSSSSCIVLLGAFLDPKGAVHASVTMASARSTCAPYAQAHITSASPLLGRINNALVRNLRVDKAASVIRVRSQCKTGGSGRGSWVGRGVVVGWYVISLLSMLPWAHLACKQDSFGSHACQLSLASNRSIVHENLVTFFGGRTSSAV